MVMDDISIGTDEGTKNILETKEVTITDIDKKIEIIKGQEKAKIIFWCKHPDHEKPIEISKVKYEKEGKLEINGTWLSLDTKGQISIKSTLAALLNYYKASSINAMKGKTVKTAYNEQKYLVIKAYD